MIVIDSITGKDLTNDRTTTLFGFSFLHSSSTATISRDSSFTSFDRLLLFNSVLKSSIFDTKSLLIILYELSVE